MIESSLATPHVAGVAARFLESNPGASPATVRNKIVNQRTVKDLITPKATQSIVSFQRKLNT